MQAAVAVAARLGVREGVAEGVRDPVGVAVTEVVGLGVLLGGTVQVGAEVREGTGETVGVGVQVDSKGMIVLVGVTV
jgi:hypothetical protein